VTVSQQLTNDQLLQPDMAAHLAADIVHRPPVARASSPHPGDVLYWVTCLGGACLFLIASTI